MNPCTSREHIEDLDNPGFCLWCRSAMPALVATVERAAIKGRALDQLAPSELPRIQRPSPELAAALAVVGIPDLTIHTVGELGEFMGLVAAVERTRAKRWCPDCQAENVWTAGDSWTCAGCGASWQRGTCRRAGVGVIDTARQNATAGVVLLCSACGAEFPEPCAPDCPRPPDTIAILLAAVAGGATLMLTGPDLLSGDRSVAGTLESSSGATYVSTEGPSIGPMLVELARRWLAARPNG